MAQSTEVLPDIYAQDVKSSILNLNCEFECLSGLTLLKGSVSSQVNYSRWTNINK